MLLPNLLECISTELFMKSNEHFRTKSPSSNTVTNSTQISPALPLSIDWLSVSCKVKNSRNDLYRFEELPYSTKIFKKVERIWLNDMPIALLTSIPASQILPSDSAILKFDNWLLYQEFFTNNLFTYIADFGLTFNGINRLDIAVDFNTFSRNYYPHTFIQQFAKGKILYKGKGKFKLIGSAGNKNVFDYFRIGTGESAISVYLYNKSKELNEVADKQHIRELWKISGLDISKEIWRLEVSFRGDKKNIMNSETGEILDIDLFTVCDPLMLNYLYRTAVTERFTFLRKGSDSNKSRLKKVILFSQIYDTKYKTLYKDYRPDTTRSHKIALRKYIDFYTEIRSSMPTVSHSTLRQIEHFANQYRLTNYLFEKTNFGNLVAEYNSLELF